MGFEPSTPQDGRRLITEVPLPTSKNDINNNDNNYNYKNNYYQ